MRYSLEDFQQILETAPLEPLSDSTIEIINLLATQVGAPEYIKTPLFKKILFRITRSIPALSAGSLKQPIILVLTGKIKKFLFGDYLSKLSTLIGRIVNRRFV